MCKPICEGVKQLKEGLSATVSAEKTRNSASCAVPVNGIAAYKQLKTNIFNKFFVFIISILCSNAKIYHGKAFVKLIIVNNFVLLPP